jgi:hypothetical protein
MKTMIKKTIVVLKNQKFILKKLKIGVEEPVNQTNKKCQLPLHGPILTEGGSADTFLSDIKCLEFNGDQFVEN